jgi:hypothetical protein
VFAAALIYQVGLLWALKKAVLLTDIEGDKRGERMLSSSKTLAAASVYGAVTTVGIDLVCLGP